MSIQFENAFAIKSISKMYLKSDLADVHFEFPNDSLFTFLSEKVPAHKVILASASPVFEAMFFGPLKEANVVKIIDSNASAFKEFLQFCYLPEVTLTIENIEGVHRLADKYDMLDGFNSCAPSIQRYFTIGNPIIGYQLAIPLNNSELKRFFED